MSDKIIFTSKEELDKYNAKLLNDFVEYLNNQNKKTHKVFSCFASIQIISKDDLIDDFIKKIKLS